MSQIQASAASRELRERLSDATGSGLSTLDSRLSTLNSQLRLKVLLPNEVFLDREVTKVTAEAQNGYFCLLPRHVDFVAALVPGLLSFEDEEGREHFLAIDEGALVKCGSDCKSANV